MLACCFCTCHRFALAFSCVLRCLSSHTPRYSRLCSVKLFGMWDHYFQKCGRLWSWVGRHSPCIFAGLLISHFLRSDCHGTRGSARSWKVAGCLGSSSCYCLCSWFGWPSHRPRLCSSIRPAASAENHSPVSPLPSFWVPPTPRLCSCSCLNWILASSRSLPPASHCIAFATLFEAHC